MHSIQQRTIFVVIAALLFVTNVTGEPSRKRHADLSRLVVVGDSLLAGYQNGSLRGSQQVNGIAALIAQQAEVDLPLPLIAEPGIPNALTLIDPGPPPVIQTLPGVSAGRINPSLQTFNLAVPGHSVRAALSARPDLPFDSLTDLVLGLPGLLGGVSHSQVEWAEALSPTTIITWLGANDTLGAALAADAALVTGDLEFASGYRELLNRLAATGATLVVGNIPDVTVIPYLTSAETVAAEIGLPLAAIGPPLGLATGDYITPAGFALIPGILGGAASGPLPANVVLTAAEVETIQNATERFNQIIASEVQLHDAALVDMNALLNRWKERGLVLGGERLTTEFLGGIFSLDGFHPSNTGAAAAANEFIRVMNRAYRTRIPRVNVRAVAQQDPLVLVEIRGDHVRD